MQQQKGILHILLYFVGITGCFVVYSLIQERLMTVGFGAEDEVFQYSVFIVLINRLVTCAVAGIVLAWLGQPLRPAAPLALFAVPSVANVVSSSAQYEALKYVSFPVQALAKCAKSVPVMAWSWVTRARSYSRNDYASAALVTVGCAIFVLAGDIAAPAAAAAHALAGSATASAWTFTSVGVVLLTVFMVFDGLTSTSQDKLFASYDMHSCNQLLYTSAWSAILSSAFLVASAQISPALAFVLRHPMSLWLMLGQSAVSTAVQLFIVFTIKQYGALNFALMMTIRQFLSIVLSCIVFQHKLTLSQWFGMLLVVGGLAQRWTAKHALKQSEQSKHALGGTKEDIAVGAGEEQAALLENGIGGLDKAPSLIVSPLPRLQSNSLSTPDKTPTPVTRSNSNAAAASLPSVLQPLGNVFAAPLRGTPLTRAFPGSGEHKQKPG